MNQKIEHKNIQAETEPKGWKTQKRAFLKKWYLRVKEIKPQIQENHHDLQAR